MKHNGAKPRCQQPGEERTPEDETKERKTKKRKGELMRKRLRTVVRRDESNQLS